MVCRPQSDELRYGLALLHVDALVYLPKLLLLMAVLLLPLLRPRASPVAWLLTGLVLIYLLWGMVNLNTPLQALFGLWVLLPLLFGLWAGPVVSVEQWRRLFVVVFVVAAAGVFLNPLIHYPWSGLKPDPAGQQDPSVTAMDRLRRGALCRICESIVQCRLTVAAVRRDAGCLTQAQGHQAVGLARRRRQGWA